MPNPLLFRLCTRNTYATSHIEMRDDPVFCAQQVEQNAEPAAQAASDQAIRPAGKAVKENAGPAAKSAADSTIRPAGQAVSDNAVPMTKSAMRDQVCAPSLLPKQHCSCAQDQA